MTSKSAFIILSFVGLLAASLWFWQSRTDGQAPNVVFKTITGQDLALQQLRGKPVLVTFWATDCRSCIEEIPQLLEMHTQGLTIVAVAMYYDPPNHVLEFSKARQLPYAVALDMDGAHAQAFGNVQATPASFLIDPDGNIVWHRLGKFDPTDLQNRIRQLAAASSLATL